MLQFVQLHSECAYHTVCSMQHCLGRPSDETRNEEEYWEIRIEVKDIHEKIDVQMRKDSLTHQFLESRRAAILEEIESKKAQNGEEK